MSTPLSSRAVLLGVALPYIVLVLVKLALSQGLDTPLKVDELGYLGNARYLATGDGLVDATGRSSYKVGYSLFLTPAFWGERGPVEGFKATQVINAFLLSLVFPLAFLLASRIRHDLTVLDRSLIAGCVSLYPAALLYATTAMSANLFIPCFFAYGLAAHAALRHPSWGGTWVAWAGVSGLLYATHERAIGALAVAAITAIVVAATRARSGQPAPAMPLLFLPVVGATVRFLDRFAPPGATWKTGGKSAEFLWGALAQPLKLWTTFIGQSWYLMLATGGVLMIALLYGARTLRNDHARDDDRSPTSGLDRAYVGIMLAAASSVFALSVLFMTQRANTRFSHWIYGRYNDGVLLPVLLLALVTLWHTGGRVDRGRLIKASAGAATVLVVLTMILDQLWYAGMGGPFSFSGVGAFALGQTPLGWGVMRVGAVALVVMAIVVVAFIWRWRAGLVLLTLFFAISTGVTYQAGWRARYEVTETQRTLVDVIQRVAPEQRVIYHKPGSLPYHFHYYNLSYFLPGYDFRSLPPALEQREGNLVLGGRRLGFGIQGSGARIVALENLGFPGIAYRQALWVLPGTEHQRLAARGWLLPEGFPKPLKPENLAFSLRVSKAGNPVHVTTIGANSSTLAFDLEVEHRGSVPWVNTSGLRQRPQSVGIDALWTHFGTTRARNWIPLPRTLFPGETVSFTARLPAPRPPGRYRLTLAVSQDLDQQRRTSDSTVTLEVRVAANGTAEAIDSATGGTVKDSTATGGT